MTKMVASKQLIGKMDGMIPDLGYKGGVDLFAEFQEVHPLAVYKPGAFAPSLGAIKDERKIYGRETPMKTGILELVDRGVLDNVLGPVTLIRLTDGMASPGEDPL